MQVKMACGVIYVANRVDYVSQTDARVAVEAAGSGRLVTFVRERNLPHCLPEFVDKCCNLEVYENGVWRGVDITRG